MRISSWSVVFAAATCLLFSCTTHAQDVPSDFAVRFVFGCGAIDTLDTFSNEFRRQQPAISDPTSGGMTAPRDVHVPVRLSRSQQAEVFRIVVSDGHIFDYPDVFTTPPTGVSVQPRTLYRITVRSRGTTQTVLWDDSYHAATPEAVRLRTMFLALVRFALDLPAHKALPPQDVWCM